MTVTNSKFENDMTHVARYQNHSHDVILHTIKSASGFTYKVAIFEGKVTGCEKINGDPCPAWHFNRKCHHATLAMQLEAERDAERARYNYYEMAIGA